MCTVGSFNVNGNWCAHWWSDICFRFAPSTCKPSNGLATSDIISISPSDKQRTIHDNYPHCSALHLSLVYSEQFWQWFFVNAIPLSPFVFFLLFFIKNSNNETKWNDNRMNKKWRRRENWWIATEVCESLSIRLFIL